MAIPSPRGPSAPSSPSVSLYKCVPQAQARHATTLPAGRHGELLSCRGFDGKLGRRSQNHLSPPSLRLRTAAAHRLDRRLPLNAARARQPVDRGTRRRHTLAAGMGVGELAAARQFDEQIRASALEQQSAAANDLFAVTYCFPRCTIDGVPELANVGMCGAPFKFELLDLRISEPIRFKFAPSVQSALIAKC